MTPGQRKFYEREKSGIRNAIFEAFEHETPQKNAILALKSLTRLRQIANHPATVKPDFEGGSGKFDQVLESLESIIAENHHILVFSSFVKDLKLMEEELKIRNIHYEKLTGATINRREVIESFNRDDRCKVFLISLKAGGVGLNLTKADYVFMLNPWWNPAAEAQAINRAHRIGQERNVFVYRFISTETIEEKIALLQEKKNTLSNTFVKSNNPLSNLSDEEIKELFK
jgi:SNF2 family DNA or RNA helicase